MRKIGVDAIHLSDTGKGNSRVEAGFINELAKHAAPFEFYIFLNSSSRITDLPQGNHIKYIRIKIFNFITWEQIQLPLNLLRYQIDLLHTCSDRIPLLFRKPIVLYLGEIPDYRYHADRRTASLYKTASGGLTKFFFPYSVQMARKILVPSRSTQSDLLKLYSIGADKIVVTPLGTPTAFKKCDDNNVKAEVRHRIGAPEGYILHFSSINDRRDNTEIALRAYHTSCQKLDHRRKLVIAGNCDMRSQGLTHLVEKLNLASRLVLTGFVSDQTLLELYWGADLYLDPSLYEGFGFQVLEAMACGVPVVCSNVTSLPEIVGDAGIVVDPNNADGFSVAITNVLNDSCLASSMIQKGLERAQQYSWSTIVMASLKAYTEIL